MTSQWLEGDDEIAHTIAGAVCEPQLAIRRRGGHFVAMLPVAVVTQSAAKAVL
jgi:hypothetical protein